MVGQYAHGNEPSHYLYAYIGTHHKTQARVRSLMAADGLAGNEDCGQMSAWSLYAVDRRHAGVLQAGALPNCRRHRSRGSSACFRPVGGRRAFHGRHERSSCAQQHHQRQCCDKRYGSAAECMFFRPSWTLTGREALLLRQRIPPLHFPGSARIDSSAAVGLATIQTKALCSSTANMNSVFIFKWRVRGRHVPLGWMLVSAWRAGLAMCGCHSHRIKNEKVCRAPQGIQGPASIRDRGRQTP